jgi:uncharacterized protein DUF1353
MVGGSGTVIAMRRFVGAVVVRQERGWWVVERGFKYEDRYKKIVVVVPPGFITDFASTPRVLWDLMPPDAYEYSAAAIVHDRLYETHEKTRSEADAIFYDAMQLHGTGRVKRYLMWLAVRLGGKQAYLTGPTRQIERLRAGIHGHEHEPR